MAATACGGSSEPYTVSLGYTCSDGREFWISELGFSFDSSQGPWDRRFTTDDIKLETWNSTLEDICE